MKSQEALKRIRKEAGFPYFSTLYDIDMWIEDFKTIERDLEVLKILREHLKLIGYRNHKACRDQVNILINVCPEDEDYARVMEWINRNERSIKCLQLEKE